MRRSALGRAAVSLASGGVSLDAAMLSLDATITSIYRGYNMTELTELYTQVYPPCNGGRGKPTPAPVAPTPETAAGVGNGAWV